MRSFVATILTTISVATFAALVGTPFGAPAGVLATPLPLPLLKADYQWHDVSVRSTRAAMNLPARRGLLGDINANNLLGNVGVLNTYYGQCSDSAREMKSLASKSASCTPGDKVFEQKCATSASRFHANLLGFRSLLGHLGRDKGLANYNRKDELQTALKNVVNTNKDLLNSVEVIVQNMPSTGSVLGPIVYEIKCILDEVLNTVENTADDLLNKLQPALRGVVSQASRTTCRSGIQIPALQCLLG